MTFKERVMNGEMIVSEIFEGNKAMVFNAIQTRYQPLIEMEDKILTIDGYIIVPATFSSEEGNEAKEGQKIVLHTADDKCYSSSGDAILNALENFEKIFGVVTAENPLKCIVQVVQSSSNKNYKYANIYIA